jgi:uncharacterized protein
MSEVKQTYILDACTLLRLAQDEPGADRVAEILADSANGKVRVLLHQINLGEVVYRIGKQFGWKVAERKRGEISLLPIEIIDFTEELFWQTVKLKATYPMSYADCFAAALAIKEQAILLTSDPEFEVLGADVIRMMV